MSLVVCLAIEDAKRRAYFDLEQEDVRKDLTLNLLIQTFQQF